MEILAQDLRFAFRTLRKSPGFATAVILTLALGIGANTAIFSLIDAVILRTLPVKNPQQLFFLEAVSRGGTDDGFPATLFEQIRDNSKSMSGVFGFDTTRLSASVDGQPEVLWGQCVSGNFFDLLGVRPSQGRALATEDDRPASPPVVVISHRYWKRRFALDSAILGGTITLKGIPFTVIGVAPEGFLGIEPGDSPDLWMPMAHWTRLRLNDHVSVGIMGRLKPDISRESAQGELDAIYRASGVQPPGSETMSSNGQRPNQSRMVLTPGARGLSGLRDEFSLPLAILMAVVLAVLLIACANVANLMLARATARRKEISLRLAIGAGRARLIRQLLTESVLLALAGGLLGFLFALWGSDALLRLVSSGPAPVSLDLHHDARILGFTAGLSLVIGILFGLMPALRATTTDLNSVLKDSSVQGGGGRGTGLRGALVVLQVSLSVVLLVAAGLLARSLHELFRVDPGFERDRVLLVRAYPTIVGYEGARELDLYSRLQGQLQAIPGVRSASLSRFGFLGGRWSRRISLPGNPASASDEAIAFCYPISWRFFETMGVPLLQGRDFGPGDGPTAPRVAVVSEAFAHAHFPHAGVLGRRFRFGDAPNPEELEIVGVVRDVKSLSLRDEGSRPAVYIPISQTPGNRLGQITIELRTAMDAAAGAAAIRGQVQAIDRDLPLVSSETQAEFAAESLGTERLMSKLAGAFAILALLLASIGLYGVLAYDVAQRAREMAIRIAIGAKPGDLLRLVLGHGFRLVLPGALVGLAAALAVPRVLTSILFGVSPSDPPTLAGTTLLLVLVALLACYLPARRAMRGDPLIALRSP
ncbi:MAG: ABC transporter permease [Thermoanaerobaculia bacterium]